MRNFQILIVSVVTIRKHCLQTASASGDKSPDPLRPWTPLGDFRPSDPLGYSPLPQMKIPVAASGGAASFVSRTTVDAEVCQTKMKLGRVESLAGSIQHVTRKSNDSATLGIAGQILK